MKIKLLFVFVFSLCMCQTVWGQDGWVLSLFPNSGVLRFVITNDSLFAKTDGPVYLSTDHGANWVSVDTNSIHGSVTGTFTTIGPARFQIEDHQVYRYIGGTTRTPTTSMFSPGAIAAIDSTLFASSEDGIFISTDQGTSWTQRVSGFDDGLPDALVAAGEKLFAGVESSRGSVWMSGNGGMNWTQIGKMHRVSALAISGPNIVEGSRNTGIHYRPLSTLSVKSSDVHSQHVIELWPEPTSGVVMLSAKSIVLHVTVTNFLGQPVLDLRRPGAQTCTMDLSTLPAGTYFAQIELNDGVIARKIVKK